MPTQAERIASLEAHFANQTAAMQAMVRELEAHRQESKDGQEAMEDDLTTHGLIGA